jgi:hypothetical protein
LKPTLRLQSKAREHVKATRVVEAKRTEKHSLKINTMRI